MYKISLPEFREPPLGHVGFRWGLSRARWGRVKGCSFSLCRHLILDSSGPARALTLDVCRLFRVSPKETKAKKQEHAGTWSRRSTPGAQRGGLREDICIHMYMYMYVSIYLSIYICICVYIYIYTHTYIHTYVFICMCVCV